MALGVADICSGRDNVVPVVEALMRSCARRFECHPIRCRCIWTVLGITLGCMIARHLGFD